MEQKDIKRYHPSYRVGLTQREVQQRFQEGLNNYDTNVKTKSIAQIIETNLFTLFNLLNLILGIAIILVGSYKNLLFLGVVICNLFISTIQEIRSKRMVDKLSLITSSKVVVIREGKKDEVALDKIVLDDVLELKPGNQVVTDCILLNGSCEVNESFITGESDLVFKKTGDMILSGSFIMSGHIYARVEHIGHDNYSATISSDAKQLKKINSELMFSLKKVIKFISIAIIPIGILLFFSQLSIEDNTLQQAVVNTVAALVGMIPEGLMLLTSMVLAVSVIRLGKKEVLVQQLYCIETLARVDVMCLDKTGTITEGSMVLHDVIPYHSDIQMVKSALIGLCSGLEDENATMAAIRVGYQVPCNWQPQVVMPFSSERKWSGVTFQQYGTYCIGAPEFLLSNSKNLAKDLEPYIHDYRVLVLVHSKQAMIDQSLPGDLKVVAFLLFRDKIRNEAYQTLNYFQEQGVAIKVISGDGVKTVSKIAERVGVPNASYMVDASTVKKATAWKDIVEETVVFGRVTPEQKKEIIKALKANGHTVAMIGDGINDVLALKEADCGVAMASGSDAARNIAELVLLHSNFDAMPAVVAEGRRSINNIQRSATLFLVKTTYATLLAFLFLFLSKPYPFMPIQMTLTSIVTIGIPSFVLAMEPNKKRIEGNFLLNVFKRSLPAALVIVFHVILVMIASCYVPMTIEQTSTICVILTGYVGFLLLYQISVPFDLIRRILFFSMLTIFVGAFLLFRNFFSLAILSLPMLGILCLFMILDAFLFQLLTKVIYRFLLKKQSYFERKD